MKNTKVTINGVTRSVYYSGDNIAYEEVSSEFLDESKKYFASWYGKLMGKTGKVEEQSSFIKTPQKGWSERVQENLFGGKRVVREYGVSHVEGNKETFIPVKRESYDIYSGKRELFRTEYLDSKGKTVFETSSHYGHILGMKDRHESGTKVVSFMSGRVGELKFVPKKEERFTVAPKTQDYGVSVGVQGVNVIQSARFVVPNDQKSNYRMS